MGNRKQKWTSEEEDALRKGVLKHGTGKWKDIQRDPEFNPFLLNRSNIDLKDKWRNLSCSANGQGPREKSRTPKAKTNPDTPATQSSAPQQTGPAAPAPHDAASAAAPPNADDSSKALPDGKNSSMYNSMIFEAISALKEPNGSDTSTIANFIEQKHEVPQNFRRLLSTRLRRLVAQDKLEKVHNNYKLKTKADPSPEPKTPAPRVENLPRQSQNIVPRTPVDPLEEAAIAAAYKIAEAENKSFVAAEAVKEAERIAAMAEESNSMLQLAEEIYEKCSTGEVVHPT